MTYRIVLLVFILAFISCTDNRKRRKEAVAAKIAMVNKDMAEWEKLTADILNDTFINQNIGKFIHPSDVGQDIQKRLGEEGVTMITVQKSSECTEVE